MSWVSTGGELALAEHRAPVGSNLHPHYLFSAELRQRFVLIGTQRASRLQLSVDPAFNVRMRTDLPSLPVKTPSYHIGTWASWSLKQQTRLHQYDAVYSAADGTSTIVPKTTRDVNFTYIQGGFFHYSNGQDGPALFGPAANEQTGNFSVNSVHAAVVFGARNDFRFKSLTGTLVMGPPAWAEEALRGRYGLVRGSLKHTYQWFRNDRYISKRLASKGQKGKLPTELATTQQQIDYTELATRNKQWFQLDATVSWGFSSLGLLDASQRGIGKRLNAELMGIWTPAFAAQAGLFVTVGYYGEDHYNIQFLHQYPFVRFGIATGNFRNLWTAAPQAQ